MPLVRGRTLRVALPLCLALPLAALGPAPAGAQTAPSAPTVLRGHLQEDTALGDRYVVLDDATGTPVTTTAPGAVDGVLGPVADGRAPVAWVHERTTLDGSAVATLRLLTAEGERTLLTARTDDVLSEPAFSPDGSTVAVVSDTETTSALLLVDVATGAVRTLRSSGAASYYGPSFSPDGTYLSWAQETVRGSDLVTARLATGAATVVASAAAILWDDTAWSPDGTRLAVTRTPVDVEGEEAEPTSLSFVDLRTGAERVVARASATDTSAVLFLQPAWGPDGTAVDATRVSVTRTSVRGERVRIPAEVGSFPDVVPATSYAGSPSLSGPRPSDTVAPAAPGGVQAFPSGASVRVVFTPASDTDTADVVVTRVVGEPAATPTAATEVARTRGGAVDVPLPAPGTTYGISLFTRDWSGGLSPAATVSVTSPSATALSVSTPPAKVAFRTAVRLTGRLTAGGAAVAGQRVELLVRRAGTRTPVLTRTATTGADGGYAVSVTPSWTAEYQVRFPGSPAGAPSVSPKRVTSVVPLVSSALSATRVARGGAVVVSGSVAPSHAGQVVSVQRQVGGVWRTVGSVRLSSASAYRYAYRPTTAGTHALRVLTPADGDHLAAVSPTRTLTVR